MHNKCVNTTNINTNSNSNNNNKSINGSEEDDNTISINCVEQSIFNNSSSSNESVKHIIINSSIKSNLIKKDLSNDSSSNDLNGSIESNEINKMSEISNNYCNNKSQTKEELFELDQLNSRKCINELFYQLTSYYNDSTDSHHISRIDKIVERAIHWCLVNGFVMIPKELTQVDQLVVTYLPFTIFPSPLKRRYFEQVHDLQPKINELVYKLANSTQLIEKAFENTLQNDRFVSSLWSIYKRALKHGYNQKIYFSILRVDYMLHQPSDQDNKKSFQPTMKQVEINTIAAGFGYASTRVCELHRQILKWTNFTHILPKLPENQSIKKIASGFVETWRLYNEPKAIVLFIILEVENNIADQRHLEYEIVNQESLIEIHRCTLAELNQFGYLNEDKVLFYDNREVAIVYFRAGYSPSHFESEKQWDALTKIEMSKAVKCPSLGTFLTGMKKIQEYISHEKNLIEICEHDLQLVAQFKSVFAEFFKLDSESNFERVLKNPENYVVKPQREGGGNNYYNTGIKELLTNMLNYDSKKINCEPVENSENEDIYNKERYVVMELLKPVISENYIISPKSQQKLYQMGKPYLLNKSQITNELGIYGVLVRNETEIRINEASGYCLRSKPAEENEAGVMCGSGALDSIYFTD